MAKAKAAPTPRRTGGRGLGKNTGGCKKGGPGRGRGGGRGSGTGRQK